MSKYPYNNQKVGIYSPYLHILGGGERYLLTIAEYLRKDNDVFIFADNKILPKIKKTLNISLDNVSFVAPEELVKKNFWSKRNFLKQFDLFFYMTDGSLFFSSAKKNFLIIQSPAHIPQKTFTNYIKMKKWQVLCYSIFMKKIIKNRLGINTFDLPAPVDTKFFADKKNKKKNYILSVGRFFTGLHDKKQGVLIDIFIKNYDKVFQGWELILVGGLTEESGQEMVDKLKQRCRGYPVKIYTNISFFDLVSLYSQAKIYWHAAGFGEDLVLHPEKAEHFGITTVEAMAAGSVPIVFKAGGQMEIINDSVNGYFWTTPQELVQKTTDLMEDEVLFSRLSKLCMKRAADFSLSSFYEKLDKIIKR